MATTINSYNVKLGMDASDYISKSTLSRQETNRLVRTINDSKNPADKFAQSIRLIEKAHEAGAIDARTYNTLLDRQKEKLHSADQATASMIGSVKGLAAAYLGFAAVSGVIKKSIDLAIEVEQAEAQFEVLTNSANNAAVLMGDIRDFAAKSPITFTGAADAAKTMLMFNVPVQDVMRNLKVLGDITGGNTERFKNLTLAFSQMSGAGRLMGGELRQMVEAGFNPLQEIGKRTGETFAELKKRMEEGGISTAETTQAFIDATLEGGRFHGMADRMADTMGGKLTIAMSDLEQAGVKLGEALEPLVTQLTTGLSEGAGNLSVMVDMVGVFADGWGLVAAAAGDAWQVIKNIATMDVFADNVSGIDNYLDMLQKRDREREEADKNPATTLELKEQAMGHLPEAIDDLGDAAEKTERKIRDTGRALSEQQRQQQMLEQLERRRMETALRSAQAHFEAERKKDASRLQQIGTTGIPGMEVGSAEAIKYLAGQHNQRLAENHRPPSIQETPQQLMKEAEKQYKILVEQEKKQGQQIKVLEKILDAQKSNGFKRIR